MIKKATIVNKGGGLEHSFFEAMVRTGPYFMNPGYALDANIANAKAGDRYFDLMGKRGNHTITIKAGRQNKLATGLEKAGTLIIGWFVSSIPLKMGNLPDPFH